MSGDPDGRSVLIGGLVAARIRADDTDFVDEFVLSPDGRHALSVSVDGGVYFESGQTTRARRRVFGDGTPHPVRAARWGQTMV